MATYYIDPPQLRGNNCSANMNFGMHITGVAKSFIIESKVCNGNGGTLNPSYYGRVSS
jgi:hypothetical protein